MICHSGDLLSFSINANCYYHYVLLFVLLYVIMAMGQCVCVKFGKVGWVRALRSLTDEERRNGVNLIDALGLVVWGQDLEGLVLRGTGEES